MNTKTIKTASIGFSMSSTNSGIKLQYDLLTTPKEFSITPTGINWTNGVDNYTTALDRIALVQQAFQAVELPPNATTLQLNDTLKNLGVNGIGGAIKQPSGGFGSANAAIDKMLGLDKLALVIVPPEIVGVLIVAPDATADTPVVPLTVTAIIYSFIRLSIRHLCRL